jgi:hypothetical protein
LSRPTAGLEPATAPLREGNSIRLSYVGDCTGERYELSPEFFRFTKGVYDRARTGNWALVRHLLYHLSYVHHLGRSGFILIGLFALPLALG